MKGEKMTGAEIAAALPPLPWLVLPIMLAVSVVLWVVLWLELVWFGPFAE